MANETFAAWRSEVARELRTLAMLHAAELDAAAAAGLCEADYPAESVLPIDNDDGRTAVALMRDAVSELRDADVRAFDELAADYAAIYLTGALHVSPNESAWLDEDHLERQQPMFQVRDWYERYGLAAANWRCRSEDNLALELSFVASLLELDDERAATLETARFMDQHLLRWMGDFASNVAARCATRFYGTLAIFTLHQLRALRAVLGEIGGIAEPAPPTGKKAPPEDPASAQAMPLRYFPGSAPSW
jgi:TorA maturation chaperone TorD